MDNIIIGNIYNVLLEFSKVNTYHLILNFKLFIVKRLQNRSRYFFFFVWAEFVIRC